MKPCLSADHITHQLSTPIGQPREQCGFPMVREGSVEGATTLRSPASTSAVQLSFPTHNLHSSPCPMDDVLCKGQPWDENCGSNTFYNSPPNPCHLQQCVSMTPRVYSNPSHAHHAQQQQHHQPSIADSFANWVIDRTADHSPPMITSPCSGDPSCGGSSVPPMLVPPRPNSAHPQISLARGGPDALNGQFNGNFFPPRHASPSPSTSVQQVPTRPRSANPIAHGHLHNSPSGDGAGFPMAPAQSQSLSPGLLHQQLLRGGSIGGPLPNIPNQGDPNASLAQSPNPSMLADHNGNAFNGGICEDNKFSGFTADRTSLAMSQLSPLLSRSGEMHASNGRGTSSHHEFLQPSGMPGSTHGVASTPSPTGPMPVTRFAQAPSDAKLAILQPQSAPNPLLDMRTTADMFRSGMHHSSADLVHETVPEHSVPDLPLRVGSMPNHFLQAMISNHSSSQSAAGGVGAHSQPDMAAGPEFSAVYKDWMDIQTRSADGASVGAGATPPGGAAWSQMRGASCDLGALPSARATTQLMSVGSMSELQESDSDDSPADIDEENKNHDGTKRKPKNGSSKGGRKVGTALDSNDPLFTFPGSTTGSQDRENDSQPARRKRATGLSQDERRERRRKSNRESARRSRMRKLEESQESESRVAALQEMLTLATDHLETMKGCLLREEARCNHIRQSAAQLLSAIGAEASNGRVSTPVATEAATLQQALIMSSPGN